MKIASRLMPLSLLLAVPSLSRADWALADSSALIEHGTYAVGGNSAAPIFGADNFMLSPGNNYPTAAAPFNIANTTGVVPFPANNSLSLTTAPGAIPGFGGTVGAGTTMKVGVTRPGLTWSRNYVGDNNPGAAGLGSYNVSGANLKYNYTGADIFVRVGIFLPVSGSVNAPGAYNATGVSAEFLSYSNQFNFAQGFTLTALIGSDGAGPNQEFFTTSTNAPDASYRSNGFIAGANQANCRGWVAVTQRVKVVAGGVLEIKGRYTLLSDPDSGQQIDDQFFNDPALDQYKPEIGYNPVPDPCSLVALGLGSLALLRRRSAKK